MTRLPLSFSADVHKHLRVDEVGIGKFRLHHILENNMDHNKDKASSKRASSVIESDEKRKRRLENARLYKQKRRREATTTDTERHLGKARLYQQRRRREATTMDIENIQAVDRRRKKEKLSNESPGAAATRPEAKNERKRSSRVSVRKETANKVVNFSLNKIQRWPLCCGIQFWLLPI
jgi:hypothetical protein